MSEKESVVLSLADHNKIISMLLDLGFFSKVRLKIECPHWDEFYYYNKKVACKKREYPAKDCYWNWEKIGNNPDCPMDKELKQAYNEAKSHTLEEVLAQNMEFTLQAIIKRVNYIVGTADIFVSVQKSLKINEYFMYIHDSPTTYIIMVDAELRSVLKAIRYIRLLLDALKSRIPSGVQPILVTKKAKNEEVFDEQGIRLYVWKG